jgi:hypothetical protein
VPGFGDSCRPPTASSPARPGQASPGRFPCLWGPGTRAPGPADGRLQPRWPLLSPSRSRCTSAASAGLYTSGEPLLPGLRRAVNPTPLPGCTRRIDHSGKATLTRANSAAGVRPTRHRPPVSQPARHRGSHGAAHPGQPPRPKPPPPPAPPSAGRSGADAVIPGACLENARTPRGVTCACCRFFPHGHRPGSTTRQKCAGSPTRRGSSPPTLTAARVARSPGYVPVRRRIRPWCDLRPRDAHSRQRAARHRPRRYPVPPGRATAWPARQPGPARRGRTADLTAASPQHQPGRRRPVGADESAARPRDGRG